MESSNEQLKTIIQKAYKRPAGQLLIFGQTDWESVRKKIAESNHKQTRLWVPHRFTQLKVQQVVSGCTAAHSVLITDEGKVYTFGLNSSGQLGLNDTETRDMPNAVTALNDKVIVSAACGKKHTLFLTDGGEVYACGDNSCGQLGLKKAGGTVLVPTKVVYSGPPIVKVGCGLDFSMILDIKGTLYAFGSPEYGQLGNNTDGKRLVGTNKFTLDYVTQPAPILVYVEKMKHGFEKLKCNGIFDFSCGANHTVAIDVDNHVYSWGFGGYGRLGHSEPKDEKVPRLIKFFETRNSKVKAVYCSNQFSFAVLDIEGLYMFGQQKRTSEANMYPKLVVDLSGWDIKLVACGNTSVLLTADDSIISWGPAPTFGELGSGEVSKSSTVPREVHALAGLRILHLTMGYSHSLVVAANDTKEENEKLQNFPVFTPS